MAMPVALLAFIMSACAGGLVGSKEKKLAYFNNLEQESLARLVKEHPKAEQELVQSVGYLVAEQKVVKVPMIGAGGGAGVVVEKANGKRSYLRIPELQFGAGWGGRAEKIVLIFQDVNKLRDLPTGSGMPASEPKQRLRQATWVPREAEAPLIWAERASPLMC